MNNLVYYEDIGIRMIICWFFIFLKALMKKKVKENKSVAN